MKLVEGTARAELLAALLPAEPQPGSQAGWQLRDHAVGTCYRGARGLCALVVVGPSAFVFGKARPEVARQLADDGFDGTLAGATSSLDPRPAVPKSLAAGATTRHVLIAGPPRHSPPPPPGVLWRPPLADDLPALQRTPGGQVFALWESPLTAPFALLAVTGSGQLLAAVAASALSPAYAELSAWADQSAARTGLMASGTLPVLEPILASGRLPTSTVLAGNAAALASATRAGWEAVGEDWIVPLGRSARAPG